MIPKILGKKRKPEFCYHCVYQKTYKKCNIETFRETPVLWPKNYQLLVTFTVPLSQFFSFDIYGGKWNAGKLRILHFSNLQY